jgi:hypothetical protein
VIGILVAAIIAAMEFFLSPQAKWQLP